MSEGTYFPLYGTPATSKRALPAKGRTCERAGCDTVLSTYNSSPTCWLHSSPEFRHALSRG
jgi:hypothetical protein